MQTARSAERRKPPPKPKMESVRLADFPAIRVPVSACTLAGFRAWCVSDEFPQQGEVFFLDGEIYIDMSRERINSHILVKTEITRAVANLARDDDLGNFCSDGTRIVNALAQLSNEPDGVFVAWESSEARSCPPGADRRWG
jgi:Putative restriction endonuclease